MGSIVATTKDFCQSSPIIRSWSLDSLEIGDCGTGSICTLRYARFARYHATVRAMPSANDTSASKSKLSFARVTSSWRRG